MLAKDKRRFAPFPEWVDPHPTQGYTVIDQQDAGKSALGGTDRRRRIMFSPFAMEGVGVSRHELGHAAWSPMDVPKFRHNTTEACVRAVEDARINLGLQACGIPFLVPRDHLTRSGVQFSRYCVGEKLSLTQLVVRSVASFGTEIEQVHKDTLAYYSSIPSASPWLLWVDSIVKRAHRKIHRAMDRSPTVVFSYATGERIARWLARLLRKHEPDRNHEMQASMAMSALANPIAPHISVPPKRGNRNPWEPIGGRVRIDRYGQAYDPRKGRFYGHDWGKVAPTPMEMDYPKLTISVVPPNLQKVRAHACTDEGTEMRYIDRYAVDQRVFKRKRKKRKGGGSVLIDASGSMDIDASDIMNIIKEAPEATLVAMYSGDGEMGQLRIVVDKGKRCADGHLAPFGGANCVDIPALEWLACQPAPRVWLSDGEVTGEDDRESDEINRAADTLCRDNNITRVTGSKAAASVLRGEKREKTKKRS